MAHLREKGKIPRTEWPNILARYGKGETIAQIGRDYNCTAPAIRYIIKRSGRLKAAGRERTAVTGDSSRQQAAARRRESSTSAQANTHTVVVRSERTGSEHVLGTELRRRVSGDVASFLVALDQVVLEGSRESVSNLQEATDRLMRSAARTRLELERLLGRRDVAETHEREPRRTGSPQGTA
jgi:hypothetical protein